ncbi:Glutathione synthetase large chain [Smittium mucronatum]|uniref:Glutathione synthetase large chain n=1 Tax=Smittium mucronatum TaxID=133383 RepID=A0A1R0GN16_9FUNG|nr:Glutathione synthetase large chain [Smittium mucronatum]
MDSLPTILVPSGDALCETLRLSNLFLESKGVFLKINSEDSIECPSGSLSIAPVALTPGIFYKECFKDAVNLQTSMNLLYYKVSNDDSFLKEVEFNTICISLSGLTALVSEFHRYLNERTSYEGLISNCKIKNSQLPENSSFTSFTDGLASAFFAYGNQSSAGIGTSMFVERYISDPKLAKAITDSFAELLPLDESPLGRSAYEKAMLKYDDYVLKPQRECGGSNTYGIEIPILLKNLSLEQQKAFILMRLINAPKFDYLFLKNGKVQKINSISELGIYGIWLSDGDKIIINNEAGHLLRTKPSDSKEAGISTGFTVIDSPLLI